jgi:hypothetical protein
MRKFLSQNGQDVAPFGMRLDNSRAIPEVGSVGILTPTKLEQAALATLSLTLHDGARVWKGLDWAITDRRFKKAADWGTTCWLIGES